MQEIQAKFEGEEEGGGGLACGKTLKTLRVKTRLPGLPGERSQEQNEADTRARRWIGVAGRPSLRSTRVCVHHENQLSEPKAPIQMHTDTHTNTPHNQR